MGFYGNITNTANTTFSFDIIYSTRESLDANCDTDGVFLGRYVLVDYDDQEVIKAYFIITDEVTGERQFYNKPNPNLEGDKADKPLEPRLGVIYQALNITADTGDLMFYKWNQTAKKYQVITEADKADTPYVSNFRADVEKYGRGYDSTVWVKHYDPAKNKYQYVMVAELNAAVPTFHLVTDPPTPLPTTPYIDRDTTNLDYYLHQQSNYGLRVGSIKDSEGKNISVERDKDNNPINRPDYSDEAMKRKTVTYTVNSSGYQDFNTDSEEDVWLDIFYNNKGFQEDIHTNITELKDEIGYSLSSSGKKYGNLPLPNSAITANDTLDWHIRLPGIGNAICRMWDKVYGYISPKEDDTEARKSLYNLRNLNDALTYNDTESNLVTYDRTTLMGVMNTAQDLIGYHFISRDDYDPPETISDESFSITVDLKYDNVAELNQNQKKTYDILKCIFYDANKEYYAYHYYPEYAPAEVDQDTGKIKFESDKTYYYLKDGIYHIANLNAYKAIDADGKIIAPNAEYFYVIPQWKLETIGTIADNSIQILIAQIHTILGTNIGEIRDITSIQGAINIMKDIIANIDTNLMPGRLLHTDNDGVIKTYDTYFPSATWDDDEVLAGNGNWVSRFASVKVRENEDNPNRKIPKVVSFTKTDVATATGPAQLQKSAAELVSHNQREGNGTKVKYLQDHDPNTLILASRNKWVKLHPDAKDSSVEFEHTLSPIVTKLSYEILDTPGTDQSIAGPVADANSNVSTENFQAIENGTALIIKPSIASDNNVIDLVYDGDDIDKNDNRLTIPTITVDNAGHVIAAGTKNYNIPHGFKKIQTTTIDITNEEKSQDQEGISIAETLTDTLNLGSQNRWINIATVNNNKNGDTENEHVQTDQITFGHRLVPTLTENVTLNGNRRTKDTEIPNVYRFGLPQDKTIGENGNFDEQNVNEAANTFNVPYIEVDKAGHIVAAETHTVEIPHGYSKISTGKVINDTAKKGEAGYTESDEAAEVVNQVLAETLGEEVVYAPFNKWIRINATNTKGKDTVTFGHEIHTIIDTKPNSEDLDSSTPEDKTFTTQVVNWDAAGHIIEYGTKTWTLPNSIRNIHIAGISTGTAQPAGTKDGTIEADYTSDTVNMSSANKWIRLTTENNDLTFGHLTQGTADSYTGTDISFIPDGDTNPRFGQSVTLYGYTTDEAGHVIGYPEYTLTLPIGSYKSQIFDPKEEQYTEHNITDEIHDKVITKVGFTPASGEIISYSQTLGSLLLTDYKKNDYNSSTIEPNDSLNAALSKLEAQVADLKIYGTIKIGDTNLIPPNNESTLSIIGDKGITISPDLSKNSFTIGHENTYSLYDSGFYKFSTDVYGHVVSATSVKIDDLTDLGVATEENLTAHTTTITGNPHKVTAEDIGLGNVENKNVAGILASAALTGTPTAPTATLDAILDQDKIKQIATIEFVQEMIKDLREHYSVGSDDVLYLSMPSLTISQTNNPNGTITLTAIISDYSNSGNADQKEFAYQWFIDGVDTPIESKNSLIINNPISGTTYKCVLTRTHYGSTSKREKTITI